MAGRRRRRGTARRWPTLSWRLRRSLHLRRKVWKRVAAAFTREHHESCSRSVLAAALRLQTLALTGSPSWLWSQAVQLTGGARQNFGSMATCRVGNAGGGGPPGAGGPLGRPGCCCGGGGGAAALLLLPGLG